MCTVVALPELEACRDASFFNLSANCMEIVHILRTELNPLDDAKAAYNVSLKATATAPVAAIVLGNNSMHTTSKSVAWARCKLPEFHIAWLLWVFPEYLCAIFYSFPGNFNTCRIMKSHCLIYSHIPTFSDKFINVLVDKTENCLSVSLSASVFSSVFSYNWISGKKGSIQKLHINWKSTFVAFQKPIAQFVKRGSPLSTNHPSAHVAHGFERNWQIQLHSPIMCICIYTSICIYSTFLSVSWIQRW